jgi:diguanylate cyclase (GGDEF)-like protein/PAS domain S-box-containing protein
MVSISGIVDEEARLEALRALNMLDTPPEAEFDAIAAGARHLFGCKFAFVSLIDADRQWFKAACGLPASETPREVSFCTHAVAADDLLVIPDTRQDARFANNAMVMETPFVRFYAGVPLRVTPPGGGAALPIGTLCVADDKPQDPTRDQLAILIGMARVAEALLEARRTSKDNLQLALDRQEALDDMARTHRLLQHAERMARIGSWRLELESGQLHWSDQTYTIHGLAPGSQEQLGTATQFYPEDDRAKLEAALDRCAQQGTAWDLELNFTDAQGRPRRVRTLGEIDQRAGKRVAVMGVIQDITDRYQFERRLVAVARTDELTGIPSRRAFNEELEVALDRAREGAPLAIAIIDLDRFKEVNDRLGHSTGDKVLQVMAAKLQAAQYLGDHFVARLGGDEFVLILRGGRTQEQLIQDIARLLADLRYAVPDDRSVISVSATIGACAYGASYVDRSSLLKEADEALYRAKRMQRGTGAIAGNSTLIQCVVKATSTRTA